LRRCSSKLPDRELLIAAPFSDPDAVLALSGGERNEPFEPLWRSAGLGDRPFDFRGGICEGTVVGKSASKLSLYAAVSSDVRVVVEIGGGRCERDGAARILSKRRNSMLPGGGVVWSGREDSGGAAWCFERGNKSPANGIDIYVAFQRLGGSL